MRVRGLKPFIHRGFGIVCDVAPHAGAWIETLCMNKEVNEQGVAPHAGAWIETSGV